MTRAEQIADERYPLSSRAFVEIAIWRLPRLHPGSDHNIKYRLALVVDGTCVMRYDNEAGKGDHWHSAAGRCPTGSSASTN